MVGHTDIFERYFNRVVQLPNRAPRLIHNASFLSADEYAVCSILYKNAIFIQLMHPETRKKPCPHCKESFNSLYYNELAMQAKNGLLLPETKNT
jgi:hypothetical protein